jgi:hypothetical protein
MLLMAPPDEGGRREPNDGSGEGPFGPATTEIDRAPSGALRIAGERSRVWKDAFGNSIQGRMLGISGATIFLVVEDEPVACPLAVFSVGDREYVRSVLRSCGHADLFPGVSDPDDEAAKLVLTKQQWQKRLEQWSNAVIAAQRNPGEAEASRKHLRNVRDPNALDPLRSLVASGKNDAVRTACVEAIAGIGGPEAVRILVTVATTDRSAEVRASGLWALCNLKDPQPALSEFAKYVSVRRFRDAALVSLCGSGILRPLGRYDPPPQIVETLIDVLVVQQPVAVPYYVWSGYYIRHGSGYSAGFTGPGVRTKWFRVPVPCEIARKMLVQQSGQDYGYDREAWRRWYEEQKANAAARESVSPGGDSPDRR